LLCKPLCYGL
nr:immunoglobulin heavy chain junction region [Mus musculus]